MEWTRGLLTPRQGAELALHEVTVWQSQQKNTLAGLQILHQVLKRADNPGPPQENPGPPGHLDVVPGMHTQSGLVFVILSQVWGRIKSRTENPKLKLTQIRDIVTSSG